jgi:hypothetical protein
MPVRRVEKVVSRPSGGASTTLKNLHSNRERAQNLNRNATELLMELNSSQKPMKPDRIREFLESTRALTDDLARLPLYDW